MTEGSTYTQTYTPSGIRGDQSQESGEGTRHRLRHPETTYRRSSNVSNEDNLRKFPLKASIAASNGLNTLPHRIQCLASNEPQEAGYDELDDIAVELFLDTIAQIAISIAAREAKQDQERDD